MLRMRKHYSPALAGKQRNVRRQRKADYVALSRKRQRQPRRLLKGKRVLQLHSEQLRPLLALSSAVQLMEMEREDERKREGGGYECDGDEGD